MWVFRLSSIELAVLIFGIVLGATALGVFLGRRVRHLSDDLKEPFGVLQGALLGVVGLILAFGLSLAVTR
jgi:cytochrome bd-type quinol oxidase subunit 2